MEGTGEISDGKLAMHDILNFSISDVTECGIALRKMGVGAGSMEETSGRKKRKLATHAFAPLTTIRQRPVQLIFAWMSSQAFAPFSASSTL